MEGLKKRLIAYPVSAALIFGAGTLERDHIISRGNNQNATKAEIAQAKSAAEIPEPLADMGLAIGSIAIVTLFDGAVFLSKNFFRTDVDW